MAEMPRIDGVDSTLEFIRNPYRFISEHAERTGSDVFQGRVIAQPTIFLLGEEQARLFYDESRFIIENVRLNR
jgi:fatty-acid peroxygenase